jgi:hypothetical protein
MTVSSLFCAFVLLKPLAYRKHLTSLQRRVRPGEFSETILLWG